MNHATALSWLRLSRARIPVDRKLKLAARLSSPSQASRDSAAWEEYATDAERRTLGDPLLAGFADRDLEFVAAGGCRMLTLACDDYPPLLKQIERSPPVLFVRGRAEILTRGQLAIVGSRNATHSGVDLAREFSARLAEAGFGITSGLALGIDGAAHRGCLDAGGVTIAVAATGPDRVYPAAHRELAAAILDQGGAIVSEFPPGEGPLARNFPRRNRVISGLSLGTLVVEAALRSGSLITARLAAEQGREVFAIPGSIHNPAARGCHHLIRQGAKLVEQISDIVEEYEWLADVASAAGTAAADEPPAIEGLGRDALSVLQATDFGPTDFDTIVRRTSLDAREVAAAMLELELRSLVCKSAGFFSRRGVES